MHNVCRGLADLALFSLAMVYTFLILCHSAVLQSSHTSLIHNKWLDIFCVYSLFLIKQAFCISPMTLILWQSLYLLAAVSAAWPTFACVHSDRSQEQWFDLQAYVYMHSAINRRHLLDASSVNIFASIIIISSSSIINRTRSTYKVKKRKRK